MAGGGARPGEPRGGDRLCGNDEPPAEDGCFDNDAWRSGLECDAGSGDLAGAVKRLKQAVASDIVSFGGAGIANSLIRLGLVDEYRLMVTPEIGSDGKRLFEAGLPRGAVRSMEALTLDTGAVMLHYAAA